jgi:uncharacterized membrane protein (DUF2068 family)
MVTQSSLTTSRPATLVAAITLLVANSLRDIIELSLAGTPTGAEAIPATVLVLAYVIALLSLVTAYALWSQKRWGVWLAVILIALGILSAAPGWFVAPTIELWTAAIVSSLTGLVILVLVLAPATRRVLS